MPNPKRGIPSNAAEVREREDATAAIAEMVVVNAADISMQRSRMRLWTCDVVCVWVWCELRGGRVL